MVITLIGYRGTGKSTIGASLATRLGWKCVDIDAVIEQLAGKTIARIFADDGEPAFRRWEREVLSEQLQQANTVIAAGGGAVLDERNRHDMRKAGPVIWLQASVSTIIQRISVDPTTESRRPSLTGTDVQTEVASILSQRAPVYAAASTMTVSTEDRSLDSIVDEIVSQLGLSPRPRGGG